jgi:hypothetical protein
MGVKQIFQLGKAFLVGIIGLFVLMTLIGLLIPSNVVVTRNVIINSVDTIAIKKQIAQPENWVNWHPIFNQSVNNEKASISVVQPNTIYDILNQNSTTQLTYTAANNISQVCFTINAKGEHPIENIIQISTIPNTNTTQVTWLAKNHFSWYPWQKFYAIFIDKLTGPGYDNALAGLKTFVEK